MLEIGPGIGTMTQYLAERAGSVVAVEIDKALLPILKETLQDYDNVTVINDDILKVDINRLVEEKTVDAPLKWWRICLITSRHRSLWGCSRAVYR